MTDDRFQQTRAGRLESALALPPMPDAEGMELLDRWLAEHPESRLQMRTAESNAKAARRRARRTRRRKALARSKGKDR